MTASAPAAPLTDSPDITVRPAWPVAAPPSYPGTPLTIASGSRPFDIWSFQTAFRWLYPHIVASGVFTEALEAAVKYHRANRMTPKKTAIGIIDRDVWEDVVGKTGDPAKGVRVNDAGVVTYGATVTATDSLAVYRSPWQTPRAAHRVPAEVDLLESVVPVATEAGGSVWSVYRGHNVIDVVAHHRDARELASGEGYVVVMWRSAAAVQTLLDLPAPGVLTYLKEVATGAATVHEPSNWNILKTALQQDPKRTINVPFSAQMPRGRTVDVDFSTVTAGQYAIVLAFVYSTKDDPLLEPSPLDPPSPALPPKPLEKISELIMTWPHVAARIVKVVNPPA